MKALLIKSAAIALLGGMSAAFLNFALGVHSTGRYQPPLTQEEMKQWDSLTVSQVDALLKAREVPMTRAQLLKETLVMPFFWEDIAKRGLVGSIVMFPGCVFIGWTERRRSFLMPEDPTSSPSTR
jgi:hypothetical protein